MTATSTDLLALTNTELVLFLAELGEPAFRARQISRQLYVNLVDDIQQMTDLSLPLRQILASQAHIGSLKLQRVVSADNSLTHKALFNLPTGELIESVLMIYPDRATVCVSTQAGCAMGCTFCATGRLGLLRNLESHHIVEQVLWARRTLRELQRLQPTNPTRPTQTSDGDEWWGTDGGHPDALPQTLGNVVFMGMGEPFANYDRWWQSVERLHDPQGLNIGARVDRVDRRSRARYQTPRRRIAPNQFGNFTPCPQRRAPFIDDAGQQTLEHCRIDGNDPGLCSQNRSAGVV